MNINSKLFAGSIVGLTLTLASPALASSVTESTTYTPGVTIQDNDLNGTADTHNVTSSIHSISDVQVTLDIAGGYDGDLYAYLLHGTTGFAVLLNRTGVNGSDAFGSFDSGFAVTLSDSAAADIHNAPANGGVLSGTWQPDGRAVSPVDALDTTPRTALLDSFDGMDANGDWTLFIADASPVGISTLDSWTLTITGDNGLTASAPDSGNSLALLAVSCATLFALGHRYRRARV